MNGFVIFIGVLILAMMIALVQMVARVRASRDWKRTVGTIVESRIDMQDSSDGKMPYPIIVYEYVVGGQKFRSKQIGFGGESGGTGSHALVNKYPEGSDVTVYFDPNNPSNAVLSRSALGGLLLFGIALVALVALFVYLIQTGSRELSIF